MRCGEGRTEIRGVGRVQSRDKRCEEGRAEISSHTSACIPSSTAPCPVLPQLSLRVVSVAHVLAWPRGSTTVARNDVVPYLGNNFCEYSAYKR